MSKAPTIEFEWELALFRGVRTLYRKLTGATRGPKIDARRAAHLSERERHLTLLAQILAGAPVRVLSTEGDGGLRGYALTLPRALDVASDPEQNAQLYAVRALLAGAMVATDPLRPAAEGRLARARMEIERVERALAHLEASLPRFAEAWGEACRVVLQARGRLAFRGASRARRAGAVPNAGGRDDEALIERLRVETLARGVAAAGLALAEIDVRAVCTAVASPFVPLWGEILDDDAPPIGDRPHAKNGPDEGARPPAAVTTEAEAPHVGEIELIELDAKELEDAVLNHTFEKIDTADEHRGGARDLDGVDELDEQLEALDEVALGKLIRTDEEAASLLRAEIDLAADVPDVATIAPGERGIAYDEWDAKARGYRKAWCTVYPTALERRDPRWATAAVGRTRKVVDDVYRSVRLQRARLAPQRRQRDGDHVDLDAVVAHLANLRAGHADAPRLYTRRARLAHHVATTVLIDLSLSSDAWVDDRRVLDVSREAVLVLGEVADRLGDEVRVIGFASHTRNRCRVFDVRRWGEPWSLAKARLGALKPQGYTRIGPALRFAIDEACIPDAQRRLLLLISDGKPTDYDRYEGTHGVEDVRQAVREASRRGVWVHGLTIDTVARGYFPAMLGAGHWEILPKIDALPRALAGAYARMASD
jgi:nitric oxide reductase activation protein